MHSSSTANKHGKGFRAEGSFAEKVTVRTLPLCLFLLGFFPVAKKCLAQGGPPVIISQPQSQIAGQGNSATFTVTVSTSTFPTYDWQFDGIAVFHTAGGTNSSYTLTNVQFTDAGNYSVVINNAAGSTPSVNAILTVVLPPANDNFASFEIDIAPFEHICLTFAHSS